MKKVISLIMLLVFLLSVVSCQSDNSVYTNVHCADYDSWIHPSEEEQAKRQAFFTDPPEGDPKEFFNENAPKEHLFQIDGVEYRFEYRNSVGNANYYTDEAHNLEAAFSGNRLYDISLSENTESEVLFRYPKPLTSEEEYRAWLETILVELTGVDLAKYVYSCQSETTITKTNSTSKNEEEGFKLPYKTENEECVVHGYTFQYIVYIKEYWIDKQIQVHCTPEGEITAFSAYDINESAFDIDNEKVNRTIKKELTDYYKALGVELESFEIESRFLLTHGTQPIAAITVSCKCSEFEIDRCCVLIDMSS